MAFGSAASARHGATWEALATLAQADGSAHLPPVRALTSGNTAPRDLADAVHCLCVLHGRQPGMIDHAAAIASVDVAAHWYEEAVAGFAGERAYIVALIAAAGHLPSTPGQAESEAAIAGQRHALEMLARSERAGCALGASMMLVLEWSAVRRVMDAAAATLDVVPPPLTIPSTEASAAAFDALADTATAQRAALFGAQQVLAQHRALWSLLEARASARRPR